MRKASITDLISGLSIEEKLETLITQVNNLQTINKLLIEAHRSSLHSPLNRLYTPKQISALLGVHYSTVLEWLKDGKLKAFEGDSRKVRGWEILEYIQGKKRFEETAQLFGFLGLYNGQSPQP